MNYSKTILVVLLITCFVALGVATVYSDSKTQLTREPGEDAGTKRQYRIIEVFYVYIFYDDWVYQDYALQEGDVVHWSFCCCSTVWITVLSLDETNFNHFLADEEYYCYQLSLGIYDMDDGSWTAPSDGMWYFVFLNEDVLEMSGTDVTINIVIETTQDPVTVTSSTTATTPETTTTAVETTTEIVTETQPKTETSTVIDSITETMTLIEEKTTTASASGFLLPVVVTSFFSFVVYRRRKIKQ